MKIEQIIKLAVNEGIEAGRKIAKQEPQDYFKATEQRLYALPAIKDKIASEKERLQDIIQHGVPGHSKDIARFMRAGRRVSDDEIKEELLKDIRATIAANEHEVATMEKALATIKNDEYYPIIEGKYFKQKTDDILAAEIKCDPATVRRNKNRLVNRVKIRLYGVDAL